MTIKQLEKILKKIDDKEMPIYTASFFDDGAVTEAVLVKYGKDGDDVSLYLTDDTEMLKDNLIEYSDDSIKFKKIK